MIVGERHWQIRLTGDTWLKSIHSEGAGEMDVDDELLEDSLDIARHFSLRCVGVDYMIGTDDRRHLLEVNHIPNVTVFPFMTEVFIGFAAAWVRG